MVRLQGPSPKVRLFSDLPVVLLGSALDDTERPLARGRLTWFAGARRPGHGNRLRVQLPARRILLRLVARDARGRTATATRRVTVGPPALRVTSLDVPDKVAHGARKVKARLTTSTPATVTSGGHRYLLGERRRTIEIALAGEPAAGVLTPRIKRCAGGPRARSHCGSTSWSTASSFSTGRPSVSPVLGEVLHAVAEGRFDPSPVFSDRLPFDDAATALAELPRKAVFVR